MKQAGRYEDDVTIVLAKPIGRHAKDARPKPPPRHALIRQPPPPRVRSQQVRPEDARPEHATVRFRLPSLGGHQVRPRHLLIGAAILAAGLASMAGAGAAAHRVDAATPPGPRLAPPPSALALPAPVRLSLTATTLPSTGIHSTRPVTTTMAPVGGVGPAIARSRVDAVHPPVGPRPPFVPPQIGPHRAWPSAPPPRTDPTGNPDPPGSPTTPTDPSTAPPLPSGPSGPTSPPGDPTTPPSDPTTPPTDPTTPPSTTPTPPSTTPTPPSDNPTDSAPGSSTDTDSGTGD